MSSCVICVVIAREIFLLQSDCPEITKGITNLKTTLKTEILPLNVVDDQLVSVLFPVNVFRPKFAAAGLRQICETRNLRVFWLYFCCLLDQHLKVNADGQFFAGFFHILKRRKSALQLKRLPLCSHVTKKKKKVSSSYLRTGVRKFNY